MSSRGGDGAGVDRRNLLKSLGVGGVVAGAATIGVSTLHPGAASAGGEDLDSQFAFVENFGADPAGVADSTSAFNKAIATGKQVALGAGTYRVGGSSDVNAFGRHQGITGMGSGLSTVLYVGGGACLLAYDPNFGAGSDAGYFSGFTIYGYSSSAGATGFSWGNLNKGRVHDIVITGFNGTGSTGLHFKNGGPNGTTGNSEQAEWTAIKLVENTNNVVFDNGSFDYSLYEFVIVTGANQNGITLQNGATLAGVRFELRGNFNAGSTNTAWVLGLDPAGGGSGTSQLVNAQLFLNVECDGAAGQVGHTTIKAAGSSNTQLTGTGVMTFLNSPGQASFTDADVSGGGLIGFSGVLNEASLSEMVSGDGLVVFGGSGWRQRGGFTTPASSGMYIYPESGDIQAMILPQGAVAIAGFWRAPYMTARRIELFVQQPSAAPWGTITWPGNVKWARGTDALSSSAGAIDKITLTYLPSEDTWFGKVDQGFT